VLHQLVQIVLKVTHGIIFCPLVVSVARHRSH